MAKSRSERDAEAAARAKRVRQQRELQARLSRERGKPTSGKKGKPSGKEK